MQLGTTDRNNNGNSSANLRGLGASNTLVLLNGRRVSTHGAKGNAVDLNSIPLAAVERVEVLKDGASAIYGTDAIAGVINFILRKDFMGVELSAATDITEEGGGNIHRANILMGWGDLAKNRFNVMANIAFERQEILDGGERDWSNGYQPGRGLSPDTTGTPYATHTGLAGTAIGSTFRTPSGGTQTYNRANLLAFTTGCDSYPGMTQYDTALWASPGARYGCAYDYGGSAVIMQPNDRVNLVSRGTFQITNELTAFAEIRRLAQREAKKLFERCRSPPPARSPAWYPAGGPYYQDLSAYIPTFNRNSRSPTACAARTAAAARSRRSRIAYRFLAGPRGHACRQVRLEARRFHGGQRGGLDPGQRLHVHRAPHGGARERPLQPVGASRPVAGPARRGAARRGPGQRHETLRRGGEPQAVRRLDHRRDPADGRRPARFRRRFRLPEGKLPVRQWRDHDAAGLPGAVRRRFPGSRAHREGHLRGAFRAAAQDPGRRSPSAATITATSGAPPTRKSR
ncbi:MAG: TonB-dependent receptor plug domain-containing protein [Betaproteobacteria bacterium]|nr:TonB-dependent receptor plug domain-containing protein [Betaproteobacteria bacterium]